ncbi:MAG TPA: nucleotidyltransferase family protein [Terracidiphilus sp.]|nr:nucleotidyltransferase family protein [Terracidiphilus sp.]
MPVPAIILAAGTSSRLGRPKQLVEIGGETLLQRSIRAAREGGAAPVLVVLGAHFDVICASVRHLLNDVVMVLNDRWDEGISTSIHAGLRTLRAIDRDAKAVVLMTCDQPRLTAGHIAALIETFEAQKRSAIVSSHYAGTRGVPAVFPSLCFSQLRALKGDRGARSLLIDPVCKLIEIEFEGGEIDIDTVEDLAALE